MQHIFIHGSTKFSFHYSGWVNVLRCICAWNPLKNDGIVIRRTTFPTILLWKQGEHVVQRWRLIQIRVAAAMRRLSEDVRRRFGRPKQTNIKVQPVWFHCDRTNKCFLQKVNMLKAVFSFIRRPSMVRLASSYTNMFKCETFSCFIIEK